MGLKSEKYSNIVQILKLSKTLLKIGMVVHVTVGWVRVALYTSHYRYVNFIFNEIVIIKNY